MRDFTITSYTRMLESLLNKSFYFQTVGGFIQHPERKVIILRHDVDKLPENSLNMAKLESSLGIMGTYYFRTLLGIYNEKIIREVAELGHEVGYHYETMDTLIRKLKVGREGLNDIKYEALLDAAYDEFCRNLETFRKLYPVNTISMHGSPLSKYDNREIWKKYDYKNLGIIAEPYLDIDFEDVLYLTDTGRRWDGDAVNFRDKEVRGGIKRKEGEGIGEESRTPKKTYRKLFPPFHSTTDIIKAIKEDKMPDRIMMTFHPQRWTDKPIPWVKEMVWQNVKNVGKYFWIRMRE